MDRIKDKILEALPFSFGKKLYLLKNGSKVIHSEIMADLFIDLEIRKKDSLWTKRLSIKEGHEIGICEWLADFLTEKDSFFDIGSCYGVFSALVAKLQPEIPIHAFEPAFVNALFLAQNAKLNQGKYSWGLCRKFINDFDDQNNTTIDSYCQKNKIYPTVMKMDIDGGEYNALLGAKELLARRKTHFLIEVHPGFLGERNLTVDMVLSLLPEDYKIKVLPEIRGKNNTWSDDLSLVGSDYNPYIYTAPKEIYKL